MSALLLFGSTERSPALRHEVPLAILDPLLFCDLGGRKIVLTTQFERARIEAAVPGVEILDFFTFGLRELREDGVPEHEAERELVARVLQHLGVRQAIIPGDFPVGMADRLRADGVQLVIDDESILGRRRRKASPELEGIRAAQRAAEAGMRAAESMLAAAEAGTGGVLHHGGSELCAEDVRASLRVACAEAGAPCPPDVMVASVRDGLGHNPGSGPLPAGHPIQVDLWPRDEESGCWTDMARTFVIGESSPEHAELIAEQQSLVLDALEDVVACVRPGITGRELFDVACDRFEAAGYRTQRTGPGEDPTAGFQFSLGHGVGLEVHEAPVLGLGGREPLMSGEVLAIEPGLWDPGFGGVRIEDVVLVTDEGAMRLTDYHYELEPRMPGSASDR